MSAAERESVSWEQFTVDVAEIARVPEDQIDTRTRLIEDLALDSLALTELVAALIVDYGVQSLSDSLEQRSWANVNVGQLFHEYRSGVPAW